MRIGRHRYGWLHLMRCYGFRRVWKALRDPQTKSYMLQIRALVEEFAQPDADVDALLNQLDEAWARINGRLN